MAKKIIIIGLILIVLAVVILFSLSRSTSDKSNKIKVVASFYPHAYFAKQVGGDLIEVTNITPTGVEPHDFEPTPKDLVKIYQAKLFIYNGLNFDPWADKIKDDILSKRNQVLKVSDQILTINDDPHFWLSPKLAQDEVDLIRDALNLVDPTHTQTYFANAENLKEELKLLDQQYQTVLTNCQKKDIITAHDSFKYLAMDYGFNQIAISGLSPEQEPSAQELAEIVELAQKKNLHYIFYEELVSKKLSETIAKEINGQLLSINPIESLTTKQLNSGENYLTLMRSNLDNLKTALSCQPSL